MSDECRPAAGALNPQAYKKAFRAVDRLPSNAGAPGLDGLTHAVTETAIRAYLRHLPASPDDATERARLVDENARLRRLVQSAFNEGFSEGMREHTTSKGGKPWVDSKTCTALAALAPASPDDATERARLEKENARLRAVADAAQEVATAVDCLETARTVPQQRQFTDEIIDAAKKLADALAALTPGDAS